MILGRDGHWLARLSPIGRSMNVPGKYLGLNLSSFCILVNVMHLSG